MATLPDLASIAETIGGDAIKMTTLARPTEDPHFVDPKPSLILKLNKADVLLEGGADLEKGWLTPLRQSARNAAILPGGAGHVACNFGVHMREVPQVLDRSEGDIHAAGNPHYLMDPLNAKIVATNITAAFCRLDAASSEKFQANLARFSQDIDREMTRWQDRLRAYAGRRVVAYHNSWPYFSARFGLRIDLYLEPKPGIPPSPAHLAELIRQMKEDRAAVIMIDPYLNRRTAETVARNTGAQIVEVAQFPGGIPGSEAGYLALMNELVTRLAVALAAGDKQP